MAHFDGTKWTTTLVAGLSSEDSPDWSVSFHTADRLVDLTARVSPNGRYVAFMSNRSLTGYNNIDVNEETGKHADEEVFLYDSAAGRLACASCNPSGARPQGVLDTEVAGEGGGLRVDRPGTWVDNKENHVAHWLAGSIPGWTAITTTSALYQSRYLSDSGRLFFTSADPLASGIAVPKRKESINGTEPEKPNVGVENVYEYQPNETGDCKVASGCVGLISSGTSEKESAFLDASASGEDVFFVTAASLLPQDQDSTYDVYDARVCGASGCQPVPPTKSASCESIPSCRGGSTETTFASPPQYSGPGNTLHKVPNGEILPSKVSKRPLTNAQKLAAALKKCHKLPHRTKAQKRNRAKCEATAKKKYGPKKAKRTSKHAKGGRKR
jgi:hypothetical protein